MFLSSLLWLIYRMKPCRIFLNPVSTTTENYPNSCIRLDFRALGSILSAKMFQVRQFRTNTNCNRFAGCKSMYWRPRIKMKAWRTVPYSGAIRGIHISDSRAKITALGGGPEAIKILRTPIGKSKLKLWQFLLLLFFIVTKNKNNRFVILEK